MIFVFLYEINESNISITFEISNFNDIQNFIVLWSLYFYFQKTALHIAVEKENVEIIQLLLSCGKIDVNIANKIFISNSIKFHLIYLMISLIYLWKKPIECAKSEQIKQLFK